MTLSEIIKKYRAENDLSLRAFSKKTGISNSYISMLESGRHPGTGKPIVPTLTKLSQLAAGMDMTLDDLINQIDDTPVVISGKDLTPKEIEFLDAYRIADGRTRRLIEYALSLGNKKNPDQE